MKLIYSVALDLATVSSVKATGGSERFALIRETFRTPSRFSNSLGSSTRACGMLTPQVLVKPVADQGEVLRQVWPAVPESHHQPVGVPHARLHHQLRLHARLLELPDQQL